MTLTRADLESQRLQQMILQAGINLHVLTETELQSSIAAVLQSHPSGADFWLFAYGSLIWNPVFHFVDRRAGYIHGWHRQFCLWTPLGRGTPDLPGLVLALDRGGSCRGIAYRIAAADVLTELLLVWRREMVVGSYVPRWVRVWDGTQQITAVTFVINPLHSGYAGKLPVETVVRHIATAQGQLGSCADYLLQTVEGLTAAGIHDRYLLQLRDRVLAAAQTAAEPADSPVSYPWASA